MTNYHRLWELARDQLKLQQEKPLQRPRKSLLLLQFQAPARLMETRKLDDESPHLPYHERKHYHRAVAVQANLTKYEQEIRTLSLCHDHAHDRMLVFGCRILGACEFFT